MSFTYIACIMYTYVKLYMCILQGYQGPGGLHDWSPTSNNSHCIGGITGYIDKVAHQSTTCNVTTVLADFALYD